jgi:hypothetical protein
MKTNAHYPEIEDSVQISHEFVRVGVQQLRKRRCCEDTDEATIKDWISMNNPFESIESAQEYFQYLAEAILEAKESVTSDIAANSTPDLRRRQDALKLAFYKLERLEQHTKSSHRLLNDLRTLRRLLLEERTETSTVVEQNSSR